MNDIVLNGIIRNIEHSHSIGDIDFDKANLIVQRDDCGIEDVINLRFKKFSNINKDGDRVSIVGNIRSYSRQLDSGKNKVDVYVFTYFDKPENNDVKNHFIIDGRICKIDKVRTMKDGKKNIHFILANNLNTKTNQMLNSYLPCIAWGKLAQQISEMSVNDKITISGKLQSREYKKYLSENDFEIRVAHELFVEDIIKND